MKLIYQIILRLSFLMLAVLSLWATLFYYGILDEINDEVDDSLELYSEQLIIRALAGGELPLSDRGSNNTYFFTPVSAEYAMRQEGIAYLDTMIYIADKLETEPARVLKTIFLNRENSYFELTVLTPTIEKADLKETILGLLLILFIVLLITLITIHLFVLKRSMRPLHKLLHWLDHYTPDKDNSELINETSVPEFKKLNEAIQRNALRTRQLFEEQKQFISNASHEIQTPLAICQNRLEMLAEGDNLTEEQLCDITKTQQTLNYMVRLNKSLLLLSKIDNAQLGECRPISLNHLIKQQLTDYSQLFMSRDIRVELIEKGDFILSINELLATTLVSNLLKNAYFHNHKQGTITILTTESSLEIRNSGHPEALNGERIFKRFYQTEKREGSTGLGLSIVRAICMRHHLPIRYSFFERQHCFHIEK